MGDAIRVSDYCALLRDNSRFRCLFSAYLVTNSGNWINYVAALAFIRALLGNAGVAAAAVRSAQAIRGCV